MKLSEEKAVLWNSSHACKLWLSEYPETEAGTPEDQRLGVVPESLLLAMRQSEEQQRDDEQQGATWSKKLKLFRTNSTPGDASNCITKCMDNIRPMAMCMDRNNNPTSNPADMQRGGYLGFGALHVQTGSK